MSLSGNPAVASGIPTPQASGLRLVLAISFAALVVFFLVIAGVRDIPWQWTAGITAGMAGLFAVIWFTRRVKVVGPLFYWDLARLAQRGRTAQLRCLYLVILAVALGLNFGRIPGSNTDSFNLINAFSRDQAVSVAQSAALVILGLQMLAIVVLTPAYLAGSFTEEKERKTLPFLFATDLRDTELVLGKLFGRLALIGTVLLVGLPLLSYFMVCGPIDFSFVFVLFVASVLAMLSIGSMSMLCSVVCTTTLAAVVTSYVLVFCLTAFSLVAAGLSPIRFAFDCEGQVNYAWSQWEQDVSKIRQSYQFNSGVTGSGGQPVVFTRVAIPLPPKPNSMAIRFWILAPYAALHGAVFLCCAIFSIVIVRDTCLSPGPTNPFMEQAPFLVSAPALPIQAEEERGWGPYPQPGKEVVPYEGEAFSWNAAFYRPTQKVKDPALLWKEEEFGDFGFSAGRPRADYLWPLLVLVFTILGISAGVYYLRLDLSHHQRAEFDEACVTFIRVATLFCLGAWSLVLAIRVGGSITLEKEQDTLQGLLMLPGERDDILRAKLWGSMLRYGGIGYILAAVFFLGLLSGILHPLSFLLLFGTCVIYLTFIGTIGLWISLISRSTLWANLTMVLVLMLLFAGFFLKQFVEASPMRSGLLGVVPNTPLNLGHTLAISSFSWTGLDEPEPFHPLAPSTRLVSGLNTESHERLALQHWQDLIMAPLTLALIGCLAWIFWQLSRRRFRKLYC